MLNRIKQLVSTRQAHYCYGVLFFAVLGILFFTPLGGLFIKQVKFAFGLFQLTTPILAPILIACVYWYLSRLLSFHKHNDDSFVYNMIRAMAFSALAILCSVAYACHTELVHVNGYYVTSSFTTLGKKYLWASGISLALVYILGHAYILWDMNKASNRSSKKSFF